MPVMPRPILTADLFTSTPFAHLTSRFYYAADTPPANPAEAVKCANGIFDHYKTVLKALLPNNHNVWKVEANWYGPGTDWFLGVSSHTSVLGTVAVVADQSVDGGDDTEDVLPLDCALICQVKTGNSGRKFQGRRFFGGLAESVQYRGEVIDEYLEEVKELCNAIPEDIEINDTGFVTTLHARHWNRKDNTFHPITKAYAVRGLGSRRDRRPRGLMSRITS